MTRYVRNIIFLVASIMFYLLWNYGGEQVYGKFIMAGIEQLTLKISSIESVTMTHFENDDQTMLAFKYPDRTTSISMEYCLPVVLLLAWQFSIFFDRRITSKKALKMLAVNFILFYFLQLLFPLLLFNISQSNVKAIGFFIGLQIFGFIVFFLILKDSLIIRSMSIDVFSNKKNNRSKL